MRQITGYTKHAAGTFNVYKSATLSAIILQAQNWQTGIQLDRVFPTTTSSEPDIIIQAIRAGQEHVAGIKGGQ